MQDLKPKPKSKAVLAGRSVVFYLESPAIRVSPFPPAALGALMSKLSEITSLFATLASSLQTLDPTAPVGDDDEEDEHLTVTISNLNRSLNLRETQPRVKILDTALSLMCFTAPQVFQSVLEHTVKTILAVLSSSVECKVLRVGEKEILRVGGSISSQDCVEVMEICFDILERLEGHRGDISPSIVYAALRVAVLASHFQFILESNAAIDASTFDGWEKSVQKLLVHVPKEVSFINREWPVRLLFWYLDPAILQNDMSQILQEANKRCFLCLRKEFRERIEWRSILICLALAPSMFMETRALLHRWFLLTGLASVLELQIELVSLVLDIISRPMWWGLSMEISSKLPFSNAYFPFKLKLLRIMAGPLSWESFQHLVQKISGLASQAGNHHNQSSEQGGAKIELVNHNSLWAIAMNFPNWLFFATMLLFYSPNIRGSFQLKHHSGSVESDKLYNEEVSYSAAAASYIAWIVSPAADSYQDLLVDYFAKVSGLWRQFGPEKCNHVSWGYKEECEFKSDCLESRTHILYDSHTIWLWLSEFQDMYIRYFRRVSRLACSSARTSQGVGNQTSMLIRRIPLGILIGFLGSIDEIGCGLLLHYAATGAIFQLKVTQVIELTHRGGSCEWQDLLTKWSETCSTEEAVAGARIVFDLTDMMEKMSISLFDNEESGMDFLRQVKVKVGKYLLRCVKRLLQVDGEENRPQVWGDLCRSLVHWGNQGQDVFGDYKDLDDIIMKLRRASEDPIR